MTLPLLPYRFPLSLLTRLSQRLPLDALLHLDFTSIILSSTTEQRVHATSNIYAFASPRIAAFSAETLSGYLRSLAVFMDSLPVGSFDPSSASAAKAPAWVDNDGDLSDSDTEDLEMDGRQPRVIQPALVPLDDRTQKRLQSFASPTHLTTLATATLRHTTARQRWFAFLLSLWDVWPASKDQIIVQIGSGMAGADLVREIWRDWVRASPLGKQEGGSAESLMGKADCFISRSMFSLDSRMDRGCVLDPAHEMAWPPLLLLVHVYIRSLLTMGDDEFFSEASSSSGGSASTRNPMTLDELTAFSRRLMNIAFPLYWYGDQSNIKGGTVPGLRSTWQGVRMKVTMCLQALHTRE